MPPSDAGTSTYSLCDAVRYGFFQMITAMTATGFSTIDYDSWPSFSQSIMLVSMYFGGMAGSTTGALKIIRICILAQCLLFSIRSLFRKAEVRYMRIGSREIDPETSTGVLTFFLITIFSSLIGVHLLVFNGVDLETSFGLNACMINNAGSSFRMAGPGEGCAFLSPFGKLICMIWMLLGRLEYYAWFALLLPSFWKKGS
jgi:trk system potassium uptake protein TrkH